MRVHEQDKKLAGLKSSPMTILAGMGFLEGPRKSLLSIEGMQALISVLHVGNRSARSAAFCCLSHCLVESPQRTLAVRLYHVHWCADMHSSFALTVDWKRLIVSAKVTQCHAISYLQLSCLRGSARRKIAAGEECSETRSWQCCWQCGDYRPQRIRYLKLRSACSPTTVRGLTLCYLD